MMKSEIKERPILFSGEMVRAILEGRKTMTRRVMKPPPMFLTGRGKRVYADADFKKSWEDTPGTGDGSGYCDCPCGRPGDRLWVREAWAMDYLGEGYIYRADWEGTPMLGTWKPSIFMPRAASRILLEITDVRAERLQDISEVDAISEGVKSFRPVPGDGDPATLFANYMNKGRFSYRKACFSFMSLWQSINGPESWAQNPWVWVITFKRVEI